MVRRDVRGVDSAYLKGWELELRHLELVMEPL
jgi:hypothetical protein